MVPKISRVAMYLKAKRCSALETGAKAGDCVSLISVLRKINTRAEYFCEGFTSLMLYTPQCTLATAGRSCT